MSQSPSQFNYSLALVRALPQSFIKCICMEVPTEPIRIDIALKQHNEYVEKIRKLLPKVVELEADERYPDCCFIEDTAVCIGTTAVVNNMKASSRAPEVAAVHQVLSKLGFQIIEMKEPAQLDGGDVLIMHGIKEIWVGSSSRTNKEGAAALQSAFPDFKVRQIPVEEGLHLKSIITALDWETILIVDSEKGRKVEENILKETGRNFTFIRVPDLVAANIAQEKYPKSLEIIQKACKERNLNLILVDMSELAKGDGALTCCSILI